MPDTSTRPLGVLEGFKGFLLWVGGSLAGITALLYTCGYLVTRAHLSMLGLHGLVEHGSDYFLQEGAKFFLSAGYDVLRTLLPLAAVVGAVALVAVAAVRALRGTRVSERFAQLRRRVGGQSWWRYAVFAVLFAALLLHADHYLDAFERPLGVTNLLYADPLGAAPAKPGTATELEAWILSGDEASLASQFEDLLVGAIEAAVLAVLAWRVAAPWRSRNWLVAPFVVAVAMYLVTLPMAYGVLQRPVRYALVTFAGDGVPGAGPSFLLARTGDAFVVWDASAHRVVWVPAGGVKRAEIRGVADLFRATKGDREEGAK